MVFGSNLVLFGSKQFCLTLCNSMPYPATWLKATGCHPILCAPQVVANSNPGHPPFFQIIFEAAVTNTEPSTPPTHHILVWSPPAKSLFLNPVANQIYTTKIPLPCGCCPLVGASIAKAKNHYESCAVITKSQNNNKKVSWQIKVVCFDILFSILA